MRHCTAYSGAMRPWDMLAGGLNTCCYEAFSRTQVKHLYIKDLLRLCQGSIRAQWRSHEGSVKALQVKCDKVRVLVGRDRVLIEVGLNRASIEPVTHRRQALLMTVRLWVTGDRKALSHRLSIPITADTSQLLMGTRLWWSFIGAYLTKTSEYHITFNT